MLYLQGDPFPGSPSSKPLPDPKRSKSPFLIIHPFLETFFFQNRPKNCACWATFFTYKKFCGFLDFNPIFRLLEFFYPPPFPSFHGLTP